MQRKAFFFTIQVIIFFFCWEQLPLHAQVEKFIADGLAYKNEPASLINWQPARLEDWTDFKKWKVELLQGEQDPLWKLRRREGKRREAMGRVISCVGECTQYRGSEGNTVSARTLIKEGDEIKLGENSYAWIFLYDGTLVRLSPLTSIFFQEFDITNEEFFIAARINQGFVYWYNRESFVYESTNLAETDPLFYPLRWYQANPPLQKKIIYGHDELDRYLDERKVVEEQILRLNKLLEKHKTSLGYKRTINFLTLPNGSLFGEGMRMASYTSPGGPSYFKQFSRKGELPETSASPPAVADSLAISLELHFRGYNNTETKKIAEDTWFEIDKEGKNATEFADGERLFGPQELLVKRIPTLLIAREMMIDHYSKGLFSNSLTLETLAALFGYRLWHAYKEVPAESELDSEHSYLQSRIGFLKEYTRRIETTNLFSFVSVAGKIYEKKQSVLDEAKSLASHEGTEGTERTESPEVATEIYTPVAYHNGFHRLALQALFEKLARVKAEEKPKLDTPILWIRNRAAGNP